MGRPRFPLWILMGLVVAFAAIFSLARWSARSMSVAPMIVFCVASFPISRGLARYFEHRRDLLEGWPGADEWHRRIDNLALTMQWAMILSFAFAIVCYRRLGG